MTGQYRGDRWDGRDPRLRLLRTLASIVILGLLIFIIVADRTDPATLGTLVGALLVNLGFEVGIRWPGSRESKGEEDPNA